MARRSLPDLVCYSRRIPGLHNGEEEFAGVVLELKHQVHSALAQRVDIIENEGGYDAQPIRLVGGNASL
jgi:hypothetical protein